MGNELNVYKSISINASCSKVWDALVNPEITKQYMYGCEVISDWKIGSILLWKGISDGKEMIFVKGNILKIEPEKLLSFTTFDPNMGLKDDESNYLTLTYELSQEGDGTQLSVTQGDYSKVENSDKRLQDTLNGWNFVLPKLKEILEK